MIVLYLMCRLNRNIMKNTRNDYDSYGSCFRKKHVKKDKSHE